MDHLAQMNLSEQHLFWIAIVGQVISLVQIVIIGASHPPGKKPQEPPK